MNCPHCDLHTEPYSTETTLECSECGEDITEDVLIYINEFCHCKYPKLIGSICVNCKKKLEI